MLERLMMIEKRYLELNEEMTVTVNNNKEEEPEVETTTDNKEVSSTSKRILPVTGM